MAEKIMTEYRITEICDGGEKAFGISGKNTLTEETFEIKRVSSDRNTVKELADKLNKSEVSLSHCYDVVRDAVYEASVLAIK